MIMMEYAGQYKAYTYVALILSAASAVFALFPFVYLWKIIKEVIEVMPDFSKAEEIVHNGWMAVSDMSITIPNGAHVAFVGPSGADKIVVINKGKVAQEGNPAQLIKEDGIYSDMLRLQMGQ